MKKYILYWNINIIFFLALVLSFYHCSLQNLTDANEEYQKQIEDMKAQIEEAVGQVERYSDDYVKLKVRTWDLLVHCKINSKFKNKTLNITCPVNFS